MGVPLNLQDIQSGFLTASTFNENNTLTEQALAKALNRTSNASDNAMEVNLDMGLNKIFNLADGFLGHEATNLSQVQRLIQNASSGLIARLRETRKTAAANQTVFNLSDVTYVPGVNNIQVYVNGVAQVAGIDYQETDNTTITFFTGLSAGDAVDVYVNDSTTNSTMDAQNVTYGASSNVDNALDLLNTEVNERTIFVGSIAELEGLSTTEGLSAYLTDELRHGSFVFVSGDQSAKVTSDPFQGVWIAPSSDPTGASGAWMRRYQGPISVTWFGAVGDAVTDDGPAIQAANDYVEKTLRYGGILFFPKPSGGYKSFQKLRVGGWTTWRGEGAFSTTLLWDASLTDNLIELGPDETGAFGYSGSYVFGCRIEDMDLNAGDVYRGLDKAVIFTNGAHQDSGIARCQIRGFRSIGVNINDGLGAPASFHIEDTNFQSFGAPTLGNKIGIRSNAGGCLLNLRRLQLETDGTNPFAQAVSMLKDHLIAESVHVEGATNGIVLSQNEATIRTASLTGITGKSDVTNLVVVSATNNIEYQLDGVNNTTVSATNINALVDNDIGVTIGGVGGASICSFTNVNRKGGNNIAHASVNYSQTTTSIAGGFGVASVVRNAAGDFDITYSNPVKNLNVVAACSVRFSAAASGTIIPTPLDVNTINVKIYNSAGSLADPDRFHVTVFDGS
jgi:hypothetical protein